MLSLSIIKMMSIVASYESNILITTCQIKSVKKKVLELYLPEGLELRNWMVKSQQIHP